MNIDSFLISDYAEVINGKLVVVGTFDTINAPSLPWVQPLMAFSMVVHGHQSEAGRQIELEMKILDQNRKELGAVKGEGQFPQAAPPGLPLRAVLAGRIIGIPFEHEGPYGFEVYLNGTYHAGAVIYVQKAKQ
ncbi:MAG: DUF6941 family protein [Gemmatimonadota bacterium]